MILSVLSRYGRLGASSRLRMMQYFDCMRGAGITVVHHALLGDDYLLRRYAKQRAYGTVVRGYAARVAAMRASSRSDLIWLEKEALPWIPFGLERALLPRDVPVVLDIDDAIFHQYDLHAGWLGRKVLGTKLDRLMAVSRLVMAGSGYLGARARTAGAAWVEHVPTVVDLKKYPSVPRADVRRREVVVGWIGSPATAHYLDALAPVMRAVCDRWAVRCIAVGARPDQVAKTPFQAVTWTEATEAQILRDFDIGIMPLPDAPWERGKCGYKIIQYMACRVPVVASAVGANCDIVRDGVTGYLVQSDAEWQLRLEELIQDAGKRERMGNEGRALVEREYCLTAIAPRIVALLTRASLAQHASESR